MGNQKMIKAMKGNMPGEFTEFDWVVGKPEKHGWRKIGEKDAIERIDVEETEQVKKEIEVVPIDEKKEEPKDEVVKDEKPTEKTDVVEDYPSDEEIKKVLKEKGVKFHHMLGTKKLRELYDENTK